MFSFDAYHVHNCEKISLQVALIVEIGHRLIGDK